MIKMALYTDELHIYVYAICLELENEDVEIIIEVDLEFYRVEKVYDEDGKVILKADLSERL